MRIWIAVAFFGTWLFAGVLKSDFLVNDDVTGRCPHGVVWGVPAVAASNDGSFIMSWEDERDGGTDIRSDIYAQRIDRLGRFLGDNFRVNDDSFPEVHADPAGAMADDGTSFIVWHDGRQASMFRGFDLYGQFRDSAGARLGWDFNLSVEDANNKSRPSVSSNGRGAYVVVYNRFTAAGHNDVVGKVVTETSIGSSLEVSSDAIGYKYQMFPSVAMNKRGRFVVVWYDARNWWEPEDVYARIFDMENPVSPIFRVNEDTVGRQGFPSVGIDSAGGFVIVWEDNRTGNYHIYGRVYTETGSPLTPVFQVDRDQEGRPGLDCVKPRVARNSRGDFIVVWQRRGIGLYDTRARIFHPWGLPRGLDFRLNEQDAYEGLRPVSVALNDSGDWMAVWQSTGESSSRDMVGQLFERTEYQQGPNLRINTDQGSSHQGYWRSVNLCMNERGNAGVIWDDRRDPAWHFYLQVLSPSGDPAGPNALLSEGCRDVGHQPGIAMDPAGNLVVSYAENDTVYAQRFSPAGDRLGNRVRVSDGARGCVDHTSVASAGNGAFLVVWIPSTARVSSCSSSVLGRRYDGAGNPLGGWFHVSDDTLGKKEEVQVAMNSSGRAVVVWRDYRDPRQVDGDIYGQRLNSDGTRAGSDFLVNDDLAQGYETGARHEAPSVAIDREGGFIVCWVDVRKGVPTAAMAQRYDGQGSPVGNNVVLGGRTLGMYNKTFPSIAMAPDGRSVCVWTDDSTRALNDPRAQIYDADGNPLGGPFPTPEPRLSSQNYRRLGRRAVACNNDRILFAWLDNRRHKGWDVYAKVMDWGMGGVEERREQVVTGRGLRVTPNPALDAFEVSFIQTKPGVVSLKVYDAAGRLAKTVIQGRLGEGSHAIRVSTHGLASGVYFVELKQHSGRRTEKVLILQ